jgi:release factor glutamine methyltransferase
MATIGEHLAAAVERLRASGSESARLDAELLLAHALGVERTTILAHPEGAVGPEAAGRLDDSVERRAAGEPVAYIRGLKEFHGVAFAVDARALIPRPETEVLVDLALGAIGERLARAPRPPGTPPLTVADVGTGSGAIAVALAVALRRRAMLGEVEIVASDASQGAADLARENAVAQAVGDRVAVITADLLPPAGRPAGLLVVPDQFDVVCANLPYIPSAVVPGLPVAASFEPLDALDGGPDGLDVVRRLLTILPERLAAGGVALLEIGDEQGPALLAAAAERLPGWAVRLEPDLAGTPRVAVIEPPGGAAGSPGAPPAAAAVLSDPTTATLAPPQ